mgnify:CR=1 FL=1
MLIQRQHGAEHPYWPLGPFKIRLPFIHYRWEFPEMIQGLIMFVVSLGMIPLLMKYLGMPYEAALAFCVIAGIGYLLPALLGVPLVPGWITPAIPVVLLFLQGFEPGPEAVKAMFALQVEVFVIFLFLGLTGLGDKLVTVIPNSLKSGIIIGAGIAAMMGELKTGGRIDNTPISLLIGSIVSAYILFSLSFKHIVETSKNRNHTTDVESTFTSRLTDAEHQVFDIACFYLRHFGHERPQNLSRHVIWAQVNE